MADKRFKKCVLTTPYNKAVFQFAVRRAQTFAASVGQAMFWMQAVDKPPSWFAGTFW